MSEELTKILDDLDIDIKEHMLAKNTKQPEYTNAQLYRDPFLTALMWQIIRDMNKGAYEFSVKNGNTKTEKSSG